jgi:hypothetical protein
MYWSINQEKNFKYKLRESCKMCRIKNLTRHKDIGVNWAVYDGYKVTKKTEKEKIKPKHIKYKYCRLT